MHCFNALTASLLHHMRIAIAMFHVKRRSACTTDQIGVQKLAPRRFTSAGALIRLKVASDANRVPRHYRTHLKTSTNPHRIRRALRVG